MCTVAIDTPGVTSCVAVFELPTISPTLQDVANPDLTTQLPYAVIGGAAGGVVLMIIVVIVVIVLAVVTLRKTRRGKGYGMENRETIEM